jgi:hAT family C-terminal dimerisation region
MIAEEFTKYDKSAQPDEGAGPAEQQFTDLFDIPMEAVPAVSELEVYLLQPIEKVKDPIAWWWDHRVVFPKLSVMALDYLSAPGVCSPSFALMALTVSQPHPQRLNECFRKADTFSPSCETGFQRCRFGHHSALATGAGRTWC